jgi:hypothetical protein
VNDFNKGHVYILESEEGPVKIGISGDPEKRVREISLASGRRFTRVFISPKVSRNAEIEAMLHQRFKEHRRPGEWFDVRFDDAVGALHEIGPALCAPEFKLSDRYVDAIRVRERLKELMNRQGLTDEMVECFWLGAGGDKAFLNVWFSIGCDWLVLLNSIGDRFRYILSANKIITDALREFGRQDLLDEIKPKLDDFAKSQSDLIEPLLRECENELEQSVATLRLATMGDD